MIRQLLLPEGQFPGWVKLEGEGLGLPLQNVRHLPAEVFEECLPDIRRLADVNPRSGTAQAVHTGSFRRVLADAGATQKKPLG